MNARVTKVLDNDEFGSTVSASVRSVRSDLISFLDQPAKIRPVLNVHALLYLTQQ